MNEFEKKLEALTQFAQDMDHAPLDVFTQLKLEDLEKLKSFIGTDEPYLPKGYLDHLDRRSIDWANLSTNFREDFERSVFTAATLLPEGGLLYLFNFVFDPPEHAVEAMHWEYACTSAMEYLGQLLGQSEEWLNWVERILEKLETDFRVRIFSVFLDGLNVPETFGESDLPDRIHALVIRGLPLQSNLDWMYALKFKHAAPELARPISRKLVGQLGPKGHVAQNLEELNYLVQLHQFFPEDEVLLASFEQTTEDWLSNEKVGDGLYLLVMICNYQDYASFIALVGRYLDRLERITRRLPPVPSIDPFQVEDLLVLRAHMLLFKLGTDAQHQVANEYFQTVAGDYAADEWAELQSWLR